MTTELKPGWRWENFENLKCTVVTAPNGLEYELRAGDIAHPRAQRLLDAMFAALAAQRPAEQAEPDHAAEIARLKAVIDQLERREILAVAQQATPATPEDMNVYGGIAAGYFADTQQATPEPDDDDKWRDVALRFDKHRMQALWHLQAMLQDPVKHADIVRQFLKDPTHPAAATPEPVGERWVVVRETALDVGRGNDVRTGGRPELGYALVSNAATFGSEDEAVAAIKSASLPVGWVVLPLSRLLPDLMATRPAPGVPEEEPGRWFTVVYKDVQPGDEARDIASHPKARIMSWSNAVHDRDDALAAAQANGGEHG